MNIIVKTYDGGRICCRPDTSWEREDKDLYVPDSINGYMWTPVLFARISKAGKCIGLKYAPRYYDAVNYGMLLYPSDMLDGSPYGIAAASCADHTSVLPFPMYNTVTLDGGTNVYSVLKDGIEIFRTQEGSRKIIEKALSKASAIVSLRIGDILAIELAPMSLLAGFNDDVQPHETTISGSFCGNPLFSFRIIR